MTAGFFGSLVAPLAAFVATFTCEHSRLVVFLAQLLSAVDFLAASRPAGRFVQALRRSLIVKIYEQPEKTRNVENAGRLNRERRESEMTLEMSGRSQLPLSPSVRLSRFTSHSSGGSAFFVGQQDHD
jgi:hypothetical protein